MENTDVNFEGPLEKISPGVLKNKTKVWVTLTKDSLSLYRIDKRSSCIGSVQLCDVQKVQCSTLDPAIFEVIGSIKSYKFKADSNQTANEWKTRIEQCLEINSSGNEVTPGQKIEGAQKTRENRDARVTHSDETDLSPATSLFGVRLKSTRKGPVVPSQRPSGFGLMKCRSTLPAVSEERSHRDVPRTSLPVSMDRSADTPEVKTAVQIGSDLPVTMNEDTQILQNTYVDGDHSILRQTIQSAQGLPESDNTNVQRDVPKIINHNEAEKESENLIQEQSQDEHSSGTGISRPTDVPATSTVSTGDNMKQMSDVLPNHANKDEEVDTSDVVLRRSAFKRRTQEMDEVVDTAVDTSEDTAVDTSEVQMRHSSRASRSRSARSLQNGSRAIAETKDDNRERSESMPVTDTQAVEPEITSSNTNGRIAEEDDGASGELLGAVFADSNTYVDEVKLSVPMDWVVARSTAFETLKSLLESNSTEGFRLDQHIIKHQNAVENLKDALGL